MLIDWFTVIAQIVNFLVLVWLLKHFLYGRIIRAIDTRENTIAARLGEAAAKNKDAQQQLALYQSKLADVEQQHESLLAEARLDAEKRHTELLEQAREQVHSLEMQWREDLDRERNAFLEELRRRAATEILTVARQAVADLACMDVQECAVRVFLEKIRSLDGDAWTSLSKGELSIRSAFELPEETRTEIQQALEERLPQPMRLRFDRAPGIGWGLELRCPNGRRIAWSAESYLEAMDEDLREALEEPHESAAHAEVR